MNGVSNQCQHGVIRYVQNEKAKEFDRRDQAREDPQRGADSDPVRGRASQCSRSEPKQQAEDQ